MKPKTLQTVLEAVGRKPRFVVARLQAAALRAAWPDWADGRVKGAVNGFAFRSTLLSAKKGAELVLVVNRQMQAGAQLRPGDRVKLRLEPDATEWEVPVELTAALKGERTLSKWFAELSPSMQKGVAGYVDQAKSASTRQKRAARMAETMMLAMEGEKELPPILRAAFDRMPGATAGWKLMTPLQRRNHLLGIFYLQTVEGRERRAGQAAEQCVQRSSRGQND